MPMLRAPPHADFFVHGRRYSSGAEGMLANVHPDDVAALCGQGCIAVEPWSRPAPRYVPEPIPQKPAPKMARMRAPRPFANFAPASGVRYSADADGFFDAEVEHVAPLIRQGCERL